MLFVQGLWDSGANGETVGGGGSGDGEYNGTHLFPFEANCEQETLL